MRVPRIISALSTACVLGSLWLAAGQAQGKVTSESPYSKAQTYNAALRYIRVDQGFEVFEQDRETGYFLFKYNSDNETSTGSIEVLQVRDQVKIIVQLPRMPEYHEQVLTNGLHRKLREEYGEPPRREPKKKPKDGVIRRPDDRAPHDRAPEKDDDRDEGEEKGREGSSRDGHR